MVCSRKVNRYSTVKVRTIKHRKIILNIIKKVAHEMVPLLVVILFYFVLFLLAAAMRNEDNIKQNKKKIR